MYRTFMWQETKRINVFRFQTNDPDVIKRANQRKDFKLTAYSLVSNLRIYRGTFFNLKSACRTLGRISGSKVQKDTTEGVYVAYSGAIVDR